MDLHELKNLKEAKFSALITACGMFFAFSSDQFHKNKTPLEAGDKYLDLGMGCFLPKSKLEAWKAGTTEINDWFKAALEDHNLRRDNIAYELANHEAYYTGEIDQTLSALGEDYTREEVQKIYWEELPKWAEHN